MGPFCIFDKSAIQRFSSAESLFLHKYFSANIPHVLLLEILADIKKESSTLKESPDKLVQALTAKIIGIEFKVIVNYRDLLLSTLLGWPLELRAVWIPPNPIRIPNPKGGHDIFYPQSPENDAINRWYAGNFADGERVLAGYWRDATRNYDLEGFKKNARKGTETLPGFQTLTELSDFLQNLPPSPEFQLFLGSSLFRVGK